MIRLAVSEMLYETAKLYRFIVSRVHQNHAYPPSENTTEQMQPWILRILPTH